MTSNKLTAAALRGAVDLSALKRPAARPTTGGAGAAVPAAGAGQTGWTAAGRAGLPGADAPGDAGRSAGAGADPLVVEVSDQTFQDVVTASVRVPVVVVLWSSRLAESGSFVGVLAELARTNGGRFQVASVDVDHNPGLLRAFQVQSVPATIGLIQGQPVPMFVGALAAAEAQPWIDELLTLAVQYGVTGRVAVDAAPAAGQQADEPALSPHHEAAYDAIERGDLAAAVAAYEAALAEQPGDVEATLGLGQVRLMQRTQGVDLAAARAAAAADPTDIVAQLQVADLDVLGGHVEDAFARLVDLVRATAGDERDRVRQHLLGLFDVVGEKDPRVLKGRRALMSALF
ncbi:MAG TPA: tetratricopeptide repeat protein [Dermatophilaceae bacterium]|nr:tetratricopeptide repeat protein [Dermatophilaceae bacterium]